MKKLILAGLIAVLLILPMGCGEKPETEEDSYEDFVAEYYQTKLANLVLKNKCGELEGEVARLKGREAKYVNDVNTLSSENEALRIEVALVKALGESRWGELESALNELITLRDEKHDWHIFATQESEAIRAKYNAIAALYPPSHFANKGELVKWRADLGERVECLELQDLAFGDGYIVSVSPDLKYCVVVAGDYLYKITPGDNELVEKLGKVE